MQRYDHNHKGALADTTPHSCLDLIFVYHGCFFIIIFSLYAADLDTYKIIIGNTLGNGSAALFPGKPHNHPP